MRGSTVNVYYCYACVALPTKLHTAIDRPLKCELCPEKIENGKQYGVPNGKPLCKECFGKMATYSLNSMSL